MLLIKNALRYIVNSYDGRFGKYDVMKDTQLYHYLNTSWYTVEDTAKYWIVVTGSNDFFDWLDNFTAIKFRSHSMTVHAGFFKNALMVYNNMELHIDDRKENKQIIFAGHSMGGAVASIMAMLFKMDNPDLDPIVITAGSPKPFGFFTSLRYNKLFKRSYRVVNGNDFVTYIPFFRFFHVGHKIQIGKKGWFIWKLFNFAKWKKTFLDVHRPDRYLKIYRKTK